MVKAMAEALVKWAADNRVELVIVKAEGRAFSAGGDLMAVYNGKSNPSADFFADEYRLNLQIERFPKPYVSLIDGIVMGGGVGISFHGSHRVMTENALFAMPEVGIGFFPDVGGSHLLPDLARQFRHVSGADRHPHQMGRCDVVRAGDPSGRRRPTLARS